YEGRGVDAVVHGVRVAAAAGCRTVILTNAAGGLRDGFEIGQPVLISDHLNLTARSPLVGPRFVDLTDAYATRLRALAREVDPGLAEGVYAALPGPHYETPAEIRMLRTLGADLVGMSTVLETIAARAEGCEVLGISLVTNLAAGMTGEPLNHEEVLAAGRAAATRMGELLSQLIGRLRAPAEEDRQRPDPHHRCGFPAVEGPDRLWFGGLPVARTTGLAAPSHGASPQARPAMFECRSSSVTPGATFTGCSATTHAGTQENPGNHLQEVRRGANPATHRWYTRGRAGVPRKRTRAFPGRGWSRHCPARTPRSPDAAPDRGSRS